MRGGGAQGRMDPLFQGPPMPRSSQSLCFWAVFSHRATLGLPLHFSKQQYDARRILSFAGGVRSAIRAFPPLQHVVIYWR